MPERFRIFRRNNTSRGREKESAEAEAEGAAELEVGAAPEQGAGRGDWTRRNPVVAAIEDETIRELSVVACTPRSPCTENSRWAKECAAAATATASKSTPNHNTSR